MDEEHERVCRLPAIHRPRLAQLWSGGRGGQVQGPRLPAGGGCMPASLSVWHLSRIHVVVEAQPWNSL
jgi:hypothetical protein